MKVITYKGRTRTVKEWARDIGLSEDTVISRIKSGWSVAKAITTPKVKSPKIPKDPFADQMVSANGWTRSVREWCRVSNLDYYTIKYRLDSGWPIEEAVTLPPHSSYRKKGQLYEWKGEKLTLVQWSEILGIPPNTLRYRLKAGWDIDKAFTTKVDDE